MQTIGLHSLIMGRCIFGILHHAIPDYALVHNLTGNLVWFL